MGTVVVDVMLKTEILDPQGKIAAGALRTLGFPQFSGVRQGKRFVLTVDGEATDEVLATARRVAETVLSNPDIEDVVSVRGGDDDISTDWDDLDQPWGGDSPDERAAPGRRAPAYARPPVGVDADLMGEAHDAFGVDADDD